MTQVKQLPDTLQSIFCNYYLPLLSWEFNRDIIIRCVLQTGSWDAIVWLRGQLGEAAIHQCIMQSRGGGLNPRQLHFLGSRAWVAAHQDYAMDKGNQRPAMGTEDGEMNFH